ncbi:MAG: COX15/CtaA family protein [Alphaproteobacteria bacterium]|nr:COX15/CtaA family protein [Alphaproteobacteria bacterium]
MTKVAHSPAPVSPWISRWLYLVAAMIFTTLIVGGATRLTKSGLSITEWQPIMGTLPPLSQADWQDAFAKYQQSSQYKLMNQGMTLEDFKFIFWWEWGHRLLDRVIGFVFLLPFLFFAATGRIARSLWPRLALIFVAGGLEGLVGWYMVKSGLVDRVSVSQYRLAAHLCLATLLYAAVLWTALSIGNIRRRQLGANGWLALAFAGGIVLQMGAGAFVAGLDAGQGYNTWPLMDGALVPSGLFAMSPVWANLFENALTVQFDHRMLAYVLAVLGLWIALRRPGWPARLVGIAVIAQISLGIATLLLHVPLMLALAHQGGALVLLTAALLNLHAETSR